MLDSLNNEKRITILYLNMDGRSGFHEWTDELEENDPEVFSGIASLIDSCYTYKHSDGTGSSIYVWKDVDFTINDPVFLEFHAILDSLEERDFKFIMIHNNEFIPMGIANMDEFNIKFHYIVTLDDVNI